MMSATSGVISSGVSGLNNATFSCGVTITLASANLKMIRLAEATRNCCTEPLPSKPMTSNMVFFSPPLSVRCHRHHPMTPFSYTPSLYDTTHNLRRSIEQKDQFICDTIHNIYTTREQLVDLQISSFVVQSTHLSPCLPHVLANTCSYNM